MNNGHQPYGPLDIAQCVQRFLDTRLKKVAPHDDWSWCEKNFTWCGDLLDFLIQGLPSYTQTLGFTFQDPFPGLFRLWDEDQFPDGTHLRRFWTTALNCSDRSPVAIVQTHFYHRHDQVALPHPIRIRGMSPATFHNPNGTSHELHCP